MRLLLTSAGFTNDQIVRSLQTLAGKPFNRLKLAFITTAANAEPGDKKFLLEDMANTQRLGFSVFDIVDFAGLPEYMWLARLNSADILVFGGGNTFHLMDQINTSTLGQKLPAMVQTKIYVGISAGSIVAGPDMALAGWDPEWDQNTVNLQNTSGLALVPFVVSPHFVKKDSVLLRQKQKEAGYAIYPITDNQAVMVQDSQYTLVGQGNRITL